MFIMVIFLIFIAFILIFFILPGLLSSTKLMTRVHEIGHVQEMVTTKKGVVALRKNDIRYSGLKI